MFQAGRRQSPDAHSPALMSSLARILRGVSLQENHIATNRMSRVTNRLIMPTDLTRDVGRRAHFA